MNWRILASFVAITLIGSPGSAQQAQLALSELPTEIQHHVKAVRDRCIEMNPELSVSDPTQGVTVVDLNQDGSKDYLIDNEEICGAHMAGANCTNRSCDLLIWQLNRGQWRKIFDEPLYAKFISIDAATRHLQMMAVSIYAGDKRCNPDPKTDYSSGQSCDRVVVFRNGGWQWLTPWKD